jgi:hypothetical protein
MVRFIFIVFITKQRLAATSVLFSDVVNNGHINAQRSITLTVENIDELVANIHINPVAVVPVRERSSWTRITY